MQLVAVDIKYIQLRHENKTVNRESFFNVRCMFSHIITNHRQKRNSLETKTLLTTAICFVLINHRQRNKDQKESYFKLFMYSVTIITVDLCPLSVAMSNADFPSSVHISVLAPFSNNKCTILS